MRSLANSWKNLKEVFIFCVKLCSAAKESNEYKTHMQCYGQDPEDPIAEVSYTQGFF